MNEPNEVWSNLVEHLVHDPEFISKPRGLQVAEIINGHYTVEMPAYLTIKDRNVNLGFMFAEAAWVLEGSNRLSDLTPYIPGYAKFSDDGIFMRGAYGPKVVDQLGYIVDSLEKDNDSRQAYINLWRERPGPSKDIPCTVGMQFFIRDQTLHMVTNMRSNDVVLGVTYDMFTFSMVACAVQRLLYARGILVDLGLLHVNAGSLHLYQNYEERAYNWSTSKKLDLRIDDEVAEVLSTADTFEKLISNLKKGAIKNGKK